MSAVFGVLCAVCVLVALVGLVLVTPRDVPKITGTCVLFLTVAALAVAVLR